MIRPPWSLALVVALAGSLVGKLASFAGHHVLLHVDTWTHTRECGNAALPTPHTPSSM